jgi:dienelactone hydrolase
MTVFLPSLFGTPGKPVSRGYALQSMLGAVCIHREFNVWRAGKSSPIVEWLRALARKAHAECGGKGVGAVGMCFTGNFAMAMMTEPSVVAPVMSQPSLPLPMGDVRKAAMGLSPDEVACAKRRFADEGLTGMCLRFKGDPVVPDARIETFRRTFGEALEIVDLDDADGRMAMGRPHPHSVLTVNLRDDDPSGPTKKTEERVIAFFKQRTAP